MSADSAKALAAKVLSDPEFATELNKAQGKEAFESFVSKQGYSVTAEEFKVAFEAARKDSTQNVALSDEQLDQVAGGLSIVGVDYAFVAVETAT